MIPEIPRWGMDQLGLLELGNTIQVAGVIYADSEVAYICMMPDEPMGNKVIRLLELDQEDWKKIVRQTDLVETEVLANAPDGDLAKIIIRKSTRKIGQGVSWAVFRRDGFRCRYCGNDKVPLTVDHLVTWESGGPSIEENLVACCRPCNRARGDMPYERWLTSKSYLTSVEGVEWEVRALNDQVAATLADIPLRTHTRGR